MEATQESQTISWTQLVHWINKSTKTIFKNIVKWWPHTPKNKQSPINNKNHNKNHHMWKIIITQTITQLWNRNSSNIRQNLRCQQDIITWDKMSNLYSSDNRYREENMWMLSMRHNMIRGKQKRRGRCLK